MDIDTDSATKINEFLSNHSTLSLSTCFDNRPWSSDLFFVHNSKFQLYFLSSAETKHSKNIQRNPFISASISQQYHQWENIKGLQIEGVASVISGVERTITLSKYAAKYSSLNFVTNANEHKIRSQIFKSNLYCISPKWLRLIDNSKAFGHQKEFTLS